MKIKLICCILLGSVFGISNSWAQDSEKPQTIKILNSDILGQEKAPCTIDGINQECEFQVLKGNVALQTEKTIIYADSIRINKQEKKIEAFRSIHIVDDQKTHVYGQRLLYLGVPKKIWIYDKVKVINKTDTLYTEELFYDKTTSICEYHKKGKIYSGTTKTESDIGIYYNNEKKAVLKNNVLIIDSAFKIKADSIEYLTTEDKKKIIHFIALSQIYLNQGPTIYTDSGFYKVDSGLMTLYKYSKIIDSNKLITAKAIFYNKFSKKGNALGDFMFFDSSNNVFLKSDEAVFDYATKLFTASKNAVSRIILNKQKDTFWIAADTLHSGQISFKEWDSLKLKKIEIVQNEKKEMSLSEQYKKQNPSNENSKKNIKIEAAQTSTQKLKNTTKTIKNAKNKNSDSTNIPTWQNPKKDSTLIVMSKQFEIKDTLKKDTLKRSTKKIDSNVLFRYFQAYHHVQIFNDSIQSICDSLWYGDFDSIIQMRQNPIVWLNIKTQLKGDSINLYVLNQKIDSVISYPNAFVIEYRKPKIYNQTNSEKMIFKLDTANSLKEIRALKDVNTIYFLENDTGKTIGMNKMNSENMKIQMFKNKPHIISYYTNVKGTTLPLKKILIKEAFLSSFKWQDSLRPKTKEDIIKNKIKTRILDKIDYLEKTPFLLIRK